jgi:hypothetical protein
MKFEVHKFTKEIDDLKSEVQLKEVENLRLYKDLDDLKAVRDELDVRSLPIISNPHVPSNSNPSPRIFFS